MDENDLADLERYIDVTRGELVFARGVLLVEGDAEEYLLPALGRLNGVDFDKLGITVCSVSGTNFTPFVKLLGPSCLNIPFAVLTDLDPRPDGHNLGENRVINLVQEVMGFESFEEDNKTLLTVAPSQGFFVNDHTLEVDLFKCGQAASMCTALTELAPSSTARSRAQVWQKNPEALDSTQLLRDINAIGKGRFAQRLATLIETQACPSYILGAIDYVARACQ